MSFEALSDMYRGEPISPIGKPQDKSSEENIKNPGIGEPKTLNISLFLLNDGLGN